ncbi:AraC family transcriptional regulator [Pelagicoccus sp. SDUM812002]|uniref:helix-turn-helix domain-containing protein n=1 Tax=Pelagicoccus sp. SDUM812002 TaxID=3041266 RepID=UPI00280D3773|nr:AraC family transcriptional regulator [Pelagicoccus sp. SDUM812002]MDQ8187903.1 AraC family transcriptional regulator [Pelagicoccus sp. SDUM812002]
MGTRLEIGLLYHRRDCFEKGRHFRWHEHPFWQIEFCRSGAVEVRVDDRTTILRAGDCYLIPPRQRHSFAYLEERNAYLSIKYELREGNLEPRVGRIRSDDTTMRFLNLLEGLVPNGEHAPGRKSAGLARVLEGLLLHLSEADTEPPAPKAQAFGELVSRVLRIIDDGKGRLRQVGELAEEIGVTQGHLRARFKKETGASLKEKVDAVCMERARLLLAYSDRSVSELAAELGFPDLFAFSRFFKARQGMSPRAFRKGYKS